MGWLKAIHSIGKTVTFSYPNDFGVPEFFSGTLEQVIVYEHEGSLRGNIVCRRPGSPATPVFHLEDLRFVA